jgi:hypothetical protein
MFLMRLFFEKWRKEVIFPAALACFGWPPKGFYLFLDKR